MTFAWSCFECGATFGYINQSSSELPRAGRAGLMPSSPDLSEQGTEGTGPGSRRDRAHTHTLSSCRAPAKLGPRSHGSACANSKEEFRSGDFYPQFIRFRT